MENKYHIFISYSRKDSELAAPKIALLKSHDLILWIDTSEINYTDTFPDRIAEAIDISDSLLFLCTSNSIDSDYCKKELAYAKKQGKKIRVLLLEGNLPKTGWFALEHINVNCVNANNPREVETLVAELESIYCPENITKHKHQIQQAEEEARKKVIEEHKKQIETAAKKAEEAERKRIEAKSRKKDGTKKKICFIALSIIVCCLAALYISIVFNKNNLAHALHFESCVDASCGYYIFKTREGTYTIRSQTNPKDILLNATYIDYMLGC